MKEYIETSMDRSALPLKWGTNPHDHDLYTTLADVAAQQRDLVAIRHYAPLAKELAVRDDHKLYRAIVHRAYAVAHSLTGEFEDAEIQLNQALELFQSLGTRWQVGRTLYAWGELEDSRGNRTSAHDYFSRALTEFEAMRAITDSAKTRVRIQNLST